MPIKEIKRETVQLHTVLVRSIAIASNHNPQPGLYAAPVKEPGPISAHAFSIASNTVLGRVCPRTRQHLNACACFFFQGRRKIARCGEEPCPVQVEVERATVFELELSCTGV